MAARRILLLGGTGTISTSVTQVLLERGDEVAILNRGNSPVPNGVERLVGDAEDPASLRAAIGDREWDVVATFRAFRPEQVAADIELFTGRTGQYVFVSSASAYQKPVAHLPIVESTPLRNPFWQYSRDKIACEDLLVAAYRDTGFPMTIVRPSHTYDANGSPLEGGATTMERLRRGAPVIVHGDGTSLWTLTHARDFAPAFAGLLGNPKALGAPIHVTSDEALPWDAIVWSLARGLGVEPRIVHVPSDHIARELPDMGPGLLGDKAHSVVFDNTRVKSLVPGWVATIPFEQGAREIAEAHLANPSPRVRPEWDAAFDRLAERFA